MNLREYAAQQPRDEAQAQPTQEAQTAEEWRALSSLKATIAAGLQASRTQAELLQEIIAAICGQDSEEGKAAAAAPPSLLPSAGGVEMLIADHEGQLAANRRKQKRLQQELEALTEQEKALQGELAQLRENARRDKGNDLAEILLFYRQTQAATSADKEQIKQAAALYNRHSGNPLAMALLYGVLRDYSARFGTDWLMIEDMTEYAEYMRLRDNIKAAADI